ncbi:hypothetical protein WG66_008938, partial [Moniliophthora roreri]
MMTERRFRMYRLSLCSGVNQLLCTCHNLAYDSSYYQSNSCLG